MGVFGRAGNLLKGFLRKPMQALEKSPEERQIDRELAEAAALERARARVAEVEREAGPPPSAAKNPPAKPAEPAKPEYGKNKRRMGPDD